jgi:hypothetical protein
MVYFFPTIPNSILRACKVVSLCPQLICAELMNYFMDKMHWRAFSNFNEIDIWNTLDFLSILPETLTFSKDKKVPASMHAELLKSGHQTYRDKKLFFGGIFVFLSSLNSLVPM